LTIVHNVGTGVNAENGNEKGQETWKQEKESSCISTAHCRHGRGLFKDCLSKIFLIKYLP